MRNRARPLPMTSIASVPATSVQPAGTDLRHPPSSWKYTRSPFQSWRCSKTSSTRPFQGWNGWVTWHRHTSSVGSGVVNTCFLNAIDELGPSFVGGSWFNSRRNSDSGLARRVVGEIEQQATREVCRACHRDRVLSGPHGFARRGTV